MPGRAYVSHDNCEWQRGYGCLRFAGLFSDEVRIGTALYLAELKENGMKNTEGRRNVCANCSTVDFWIIYTWCRCRAHLSFYTLSEDAAEGMAGEEK